MAIIGVIEDEPETRPLDVKELRLTSLVGVSIVVEEASSLNL